MLLFEEEIDFLLIYTKNHNANFLHAPFELYTFTHSKVFFRIFFSIYRRTLNQIQCSHLFESL